MYIRSRVLMLLATLLAGCFFVGTFDPEGQQEKKEVMTMHALLGVMEQMHLRPVQVNNEFSEKAFDDYLSYLDGSKRFFIQAEVDDLAAFREQLDDQANDRTLQFFDKSLDLLDKAIVRSKMLYESEIDREFDLATDEFFELDSEKREYARDEEQLRDYWRKTLKYQIISKVESRLENQKDKEESEQKTLEELVAKATEDTRDQYDRWFDRMEELRRSDRFEVYMNVFTQLYDPHSNYYSPKEKEEFDIRMGGKLEGIGARLTRDEDYIKVSSIVPGGPAWKEGNLEVGDLITKVAQKGEEAVDIVGFRTDDAVQLIRGDKGTVVILTVKKKDGTFKDVEIKRDEVIIDAAFARSVILEVEDEVEKVGYIKLPMFYSTFDGGNSCAHDVAVEIEKLKEEKVNGIILDLRYNGGGSLPDVIEMSGLFIEEGPIVQVKSRDEDPQVYRDRDEDVAYDGPLIVMVNNISASASEILAAALQDYGRAVIVGSDHTFGKGTVQRFLDLDRVIRGNSDQKPLGQVKITMQQFFRINGGSTQLRGVTPDIVLPDQYSYVEVGEKEYEEALQWTEIPSTDYEQHVYTLPDLKILQKLSAERVRNDTTFTMIQEQGMLMKEMREQSRMPLNLEAYTSELKSRDEKLERFDNLMRDDIPHLQVETLASYEEYIQTDSTLIARHDAWLKQIRKDVHLEETLHIMKDLLQYDPKYVKHSIEEEVDDH